MKNRDKYQVKIECPRCKKEGVAYISQETQQDNLDQAIDKIEGDFAIRIHDTGILVDCQSCGYDTWYKELFFLLPDTSQ